MKTKCAILGIVVAVVALTWTSVSVFSVPPQPNGACVYKNGTCQITPQNICRLSKGTWLGPDTTCP
jgi:hypothetical protein